MFNHYPKNTSVIIPAGLCGPVAFICPEIWWPTRGIKHAMPGLNIIFPHPPRSRWLSGRFFFLSWEIRRQQILSIHRAQMICPGAKSCHFSFIFYFFIFSFIFFRSGQRCSDNLCNNLWYLVTDIIPHFSVQSCCLTFVISIVFFAVAVLAVAIFRCCFSNYYWAVGNLILWMQGQHLQTCNISI